MLSIHYSPYYEGMPLRETRIPKETMYKNPIELLEEEEKALEAKIYGTPSEEATTESETATTEEATKEAPKETEQVTQKPEPTEVAETGEDWEKRYKNLRSSRDENLYKTKTQLAAALETISTLQAQITKLQQEKPKVDPLEGVFTEEDTETLGQATVEAMRRATRKATEAATAPLQKELEAERKRRQEADTLMAKNAKEEAYGIFISRIAQAVPNWEAINYDPEFEKFMSEADFDGTLRKVYFHEAEAQGNAALVIRYMREFEATGKKPSKLASKITPVGDQASTTVATTKKPEVITKAYINKFYEDLSKGKYRGRTKEADAIEARIEKAVMGGHVVA